MIFVNKPLDFSLYPFHFALRIFSISSFSFESRSRCSSTSEYDWLFTWSSVSEAYFCMVAMVAVYISSGVEGRCVRSIYCTLNT